MCLDGMSGSWSGRWEQGPGNIGSERLDLLLERGNLMGLGMDKDGPFTVGGTYSPDGSVSYTKTYRPKTAWVCGPMTYTGRWNGTVIHGAWSEDAMPTLNHGPFALRPGKWPVSPLSEAASAETPEGTEAPLPTKP